MSLQGILLLDFFGILLILVTLNLVRTRRLHVVYAVIWFVAVALMMIIISIPPLLTLVTAAVGAHFPASAMTLLAFVLIVGILILFSIQLSTIAARQIEIAQALALREHLDEEPPLERPKGGG